MKSYLYKKSNLNYIPIIVLIALLILLYIRRVTIETNEPLRRLKGVTA